MRVLLISDTHRGFSPSTAKIHMRWADEVLSKLEYDVLILAGDLSSHKQRQFYSSLKFFRKVAGPDRDILLVRGNHDFWDGDIKNFDAMLARHTDWFQEFRITHLQSSWSYVKDDVAFVGWDGWYWQLPSNSNDTRWIPSGGIQLLDQQAPKSFENSLRIAEELSQTYDKIVGVTHFPCLRGLGDMRYGGNPHYGEIILPYLDVLCMGHSHQRVDLEIQGTRLYNCGSDYEKPNHILFEV